MTESQVEALLAKQLGLEIARRRHAKNWSQQALAEAIGRSPNHVQLLESGLSDRKKNTPANPRLNTLVALSRALDVPLPELIGSVVAGVPSAK
ncbi:helix-turn-helix domain-containing protein [Gordonia hydrophobica]|uniref:Helix-turn-helix transcriptional regulator n=1 Tax=Gordonia hydrophobica TaxID=40516 RepID=A0ABZ2U1F5_9ACTN|nr:helix-turn-helix transcriptional regulator [Gordonia hydrophobica]MBM7368588.1 transcriptional regulator with XRE-family HTH domain [Gordonia hydrophobica]